MAAVVATFELKKETYARIRDLVYQRCGIALGDQKEALVRARLNKLVRKHGLHSYEEYLAKIEKDADGESLGELIDAISTNTTHLFRESAHFDLLAKLLREWGEQNAGGTQTRRIWSAACSSGEEPYSIAMTCEDALANYPRLECKILATDISTRILNQARAARFDESRMGSTPAAFRNRFLRRTHDDDGVIYEPAPELRKRITFSHFNLMTPAFPFRNGFDVIFLRNVMIYFDRPTQEGLVARMASVLKPGGYLLIGHSESLNAINHALSYVQPAVYRKPESGEKPTRSGRAK